jgi:hypothetical protein
MVSASLAELLDDLPAHAAVLDGTGDVRHVNVAWRRFAEENGLADAAYGVGSNYLEVCAQACHTDPFASEAKDALERVLDGRLERFAFTYPCHSPTERRWFFCLFLAWEASVVVLHFNHRQQMDGHRLMRDAAGRIQALRREPTARRAATATLPA